MKAALAKLPVSTKFTLIALVGLVPLFFSTWLWLGESTRLSDQVGRERAGLALHASLKSVLAAVTTHRENAVRARLGDAAAKAALEASGMAVRDALGEAKVLAGDGTWPEETAKALADAVTSWDVVQRAVGTRTAEETLVEHGELIALNVLPLMAEVGRVSGLHRDPQPASFYLNRIAVERLPGLSARLGEAQALVAVVGSREQLVASEIDRLQVIAVLSQADLDAIDADAQSLFRIEADLRGPLEGSLREVDRPGNKFLRALENAIQFSRGAKGAWKWQAENVAPVDKAFIAYDRSHLALANILVARHAELRRDRELLLTLTIVLVGIAGLFGFALMRSVSSAIGRALVVADRVAGGDLSQAIEVRGADETARLMQALQSMNKGLARMVGEVRTASEAIGSDVRLLSEGNRNLSERTESQATAIEQAASSMEELTASVRQNTDSARETQRIAGLAGDATSRGIEAASRVVDHMESIREGTRRVAEIVGLIDSIAFQTNILALNAAVEAARAGEHGRGFAVVAAEVRTLSRRCAESAREIRALIDNSTERVADGTKRVDEVSEAIGDINSRVSEVGELMNRIVQASAEQSSGIEQVGQTISQMERVTQQNAAMVEEIMAATESLTQQTARLGSLVGAFRLGDATQRQAQAAARAAAGDVTGTGRKRGAADSAVLPGARTPRLPSR
jgi:methyl-accepting chemotaxis protein